MSLRESTLGQWGVLVAFVAIFGLLVALAGVEPASAAPDTTAPTTPSGLSARVLSGDPFDVHPDGETAGPAGLAGATSSIRVGVVGSAARTGDGGLRSASIDAPSFAQWGDGVVPAGTTHAAVRTWVRLDSRGVDQSVDLLTVANSQGRRNFDFFVTGDTQRFKWDLFSVDANESNFTVVPGR